MALLSALAAAEETRAAGAAVTVTSNRWPQRLAPVLVAMTAGAIVAVTGAQDVVPSVPLVLAGLTAAVAALVVAASAHRTGRRRE
jgi:peptidoglycan/LPS O-acetylase OafA/YrhL